MEEKEILDSTEKTVVAETEETTAPTEEVKEEVSSPVEDAPAEENSEEAPAENASEENPEAEESKPMSKKKKILNAVLLAVQILLVVLAITITMIVILNPKTDEVSSAGIKLLPVESGSMDGTWTDEETGKEYKGFPKGALVFATKPKNSGYDLQVGDIVTFRKLEEKSNTMILVTHRIIERRENADTGMPEYVTKGDANPTPDKVTDSGTEIKHWYPGDILAVYSFHINNLGFALDWVREGYHFIYVIIIPLGLLLLYNIYLVAQIVIEGKMKKANAAAAEKAKQAALASIDEEEIKRRAIEEYLKSQAATAAGDAPQDDGGTK